LEDDCFITIRCKKSLSLSLKQINDDDDDADYDDDVIYWLFNLSRSALRVCPSNTMSIIARQLRRRLFEHAGASMPRSDVKETSESLRITSRL